MSDRGNKRRAAVHWAVGDPETLRLIIEHGGNVNMIDGNGASPLLLAIAHGRPESAQLLIDAGCKINLYHSDGRQPLHHAAIYGELETLNYLFEKGIEANVLTEHGSSALLLASIEGHANIVKSLIEHGANVNLVYYDAVTALSVAASNRKHDVMLELLVVGAKPDLIGQRKHLPIVHCTINNDIKSVIILLQGNASLGMLHKTIENENANIMEHTHPLHIAIVKNHSNLILLLASIEHNVNFIRWQLKNGVAYYYIESDDVLHVLCDTARVPPRLQLLCRAVIRQCLGTPFLAKVMALDSIPAPMKNYILMQELWQWLD